MMILPPSKIFIGGLGYTGSRIASEFHSVYPHAHISGTVRSKERQEALLSSPPNWLTGNVHVLDIDDQYIGLGDSSNKEGIGDLLDADTIIQTVAPIADFDRDPLLAFHGEQIMQSSSDNGSDGASLSKLQYVAYVSSTGVYGNHDGKWVTEEADLLCTDAKSLARVQAEKEWGYLEKENVVRVDCFRCGGIYGPGRGPLFSSIQSLTEEALVKEEEEEDVQGKDLIATPIKYVNRIMVDDISGAILTARNGKREFSPGGRAYNLVDDDPAPRREVVNEARRLLVIASSEEDAENATIMPPPKKARRLRISRGTGNKRCKNERLKKDYGWKPKFPTFREGLASLMQSAALK